MILRGEKFLIQKQRGTQLSRGAVAIISEKSNG